MADDLESFLNEFGRIAPAFCTNLQRVSHDPEVSKVVSVYGAGLTSAMEGTANVLRAYVGTLPPSQQEQINQVFAASGGTALLAAANETLAGDGLGTLASLSAIPGIIEIAKRIIENFIKIPGPPGKLLEKIDLILDGLGKLFGFPKTSPEPKTDSPVIPWTFPWTPSGDESESEQDFRHRLIQAWIDEILTFGRDKARDVRAAQALRDIRLKGEITDADFSTARSIKDETLGN